MVLYSVLMVSTQYIKVNESDLYNAVLKSDSDIGIVIQEDAETLTVGEVWEQSEWSED